VKSWRILFLVSSFVAIFAVILSFVEFEYGYVPNEDQILNDYKTGFGDKVTYDVMGTFIRPEEAMFLSKNQRQKRLSPEKGAVKVDDELINLGKELFYKETFGNEIFLTDILGFIDGPVGIPNIMKAIIELKGEATTNLRVELSEDVTIGDQTIRRGDAVSLVLAAADRDPAPILWQACVDDCNRHRPHHTSPESRGNPR
jgi:hypothetical protein